MSRKEESLFSRLTRLFRPEKEENKKEDEDVYLADPLERFERAIRKESESSGE
jgi:hypothetical protein